MCLPHKSAQLAKPITLSCQLQNASPRTSTLRFFSLPHEIKKSKSNTQATLSVYEEKKSLHVLPRATIPCFLIAKIGKKNKSTIFYTISKCKIQYIIKFQNIANSSDIFFVPPTLHFRKQTIAVRQTQDCDAEF